MWNRLSGVASGVANYVATPTDEAQRQERETYQERLRDAQDIIKQRDLEILNLSNRTKSTTDQTTEDDLENIRCKLEQFKIDPADTDTFEEVLSEISFSLTEKTSTISDLQKVIDDMKSRRYNDTSPPNSPTCNDFYESQISRLTDLCTSLRKKEKITTAESEELRCELGDARSEIARLKTVASEQSAVQCDEGLQNSLARLEEENKLLLAKVASEAAHKDILRDELDMFKENNQEKHALLENIAELQEELQNKSGLLELERRNVGELSDNFEKVQSQLTDMLSEKQTKIHNNLFEVKEEEGYTETIDRMKVENDMLIAKISDLMKSRDQDREEIDLMKERSSQSRDTLLLELQGKEQELEDAMMIVSLLQEQIQDKPDSQNLSQLLDEMKERNVLAPRISFLQAELTEARQKLEEQTQKEVELKTRLADSLTEIEQLREMDGSRVLSSVCEDETTNSVGEHPELQELITTAELLSGRFSCSTPPDLAERESFKSENDRLKNCLRARDELIAGLQQDIHIRQEKESNYREKVAELQNQIENNQDESVKGIIDFSGSFVAGLEEQLTLAEGLLKIKNEEIIGLNKALDDYTNRPITPLSPAPRHDLYMESNIKELNQKVQDLNVHLNDAKEENIQLQSTVQDKDNEISTVQQEKYEKELDIERIQKEYEAELINMSSNYKDQKAVNSEELGNLTTKVDDLESDRKDLERENTHLREMFERVSDDYNALKEQLENLDRDDEDSETSALHVKYNLKEQQLQNAIVEIEALNDIITSNNEAIAGLECTLSQQREINVNLQDTVDELKDKCEVLENKELDYLEQISALKKDVEQAGVISVELKRTLCGTQEELHKAIRENKINGDQDSSIKHSIRELSSSLQELKLSKESLKADVQTDLNNIAAHWEECVEEIRSQALQVSSSSSCNSGIGEKISGAISNIKTLQSDYLSIKSEVEKMLYCDMNTMFPELKAELKNIASLAAQKDEEIESLKEEVKKYKVTGKKIIDKLKKQLKEKECLVKKLSSDSKDSTAVVLQEENSSLSKQLSVLERDNDQLKEEISDLKNTSINISRNNANDTLDFNDSLNCSQKSVHDESMSQLCVHIESFVKQYQDVFSYQIIDNDFTIDNFNVTASRMITCAQDHISKIDILQNKTDELQNKTDELHSTNVTLVDDLNILKQAKESTEETVKSKIDHIKILENALDDLTEGIRDTKAAVEEADSQLFERNGEVQSLKSEIEYLQSCLAKHELLIGDKNSEIETCLSEISTLKELLENQASDMNSNEVDSNITTTHAAELEAAQDKVEALEWDLSDLNQKLEDKEHEVKRLSDKMEVLIAECADKNATIEDLETKCEDLEGCIDTLTSQVSVIAEDKDYVETSFSEKQSNLEQLLNSSKCEINELKDSLSEKTNEAKKYLAVVKKFKAAREEMQKELKEKEQLIQKLQNPTNNLLLVDCEDVPAESLPEITQVQQTAVYTANPGVSTISEDNVSVTHIATQSSVTESHDAQCQSPDYIDQEEKISTLESDVTHLYSVNRTLEENVTHNEQLVSSLSEQLNLSKCLLTETREECEKKLLELAEKQEQYVEQINQMQKAKEEWLEKEKQMVSSLTEAEAVKLMSGVREHDQDTVSEVSHASVMSHDTSYVSSHYFREMPSDVESLQAELLKKNKMAFLIKTKAKKLESRVRDAKREADKSRAHEKVKEKILAVENELANITGQLRNLSAGKKTEGTSSRIDPKYVEEMEHRLNVLTQVEQKYENLMEELQVQIHSRSVAESQRDEMNDIITSLQNRNDDLTSELRDKDAILCEHIDASAHENGSIREQYENQNSELLHLRDLNKKMKDALIQMTEESTRIEQTYKSTMHDLEDDSDQLKVDNATLSNELTNCWAKIEDLEEQNNSYMRMLEDAHRQLQYNNSSTSNIDALQQECEALTSQKDNCLKANKDLTEKLLISEREKSEVIKQLVEIKDLYDECLQSRNIISQEKEKLVMLVNELENKLAEKDADIKENLEAYDNVQTSLTTCMQDKITLEQANINIQTELSDSKTNYDKLKSKLKHLQDENRSICERLEDSEDSTESLQNQLNIATEEKKDLDQRIVTVHNQLNSLLSDHEGCSGNIASLEAHCSALEKQLMESNELIESLKEEQNVIVESNLESVNEKDAEIERISASLNDLRNSHEGSETTREELEAAVNEKNQQKQEFETELTALKEQIAKLQHDETENNDIYSKKIKLLTAELENLQNELTDKTNTESSLNENIEVYSQKIDFLTEEVDRLQKELTDKTDTELSLKSTIEELSNSLQNLKLSQESNENVRNELVSQEIADLKQANSDLEGQVSTLETSNAEYFSQIQDASYKLEQWLYYNEEQQNLMAGLQEQKQSLESCISENDSELAELLVKMAQLEEKEAEIKSLEQQLEDAYAGNEEAIKLANENIEKLTISNSKFKESSQQLSDDLEKSRHQNEEDSQQISELSTLLQNWQVYDQEQKNRIDDLNEQIQVHRDTFEKLKAEKQQLIDDLDKTVSVKEIEQLNEKLSSAEEVIQSLEIFSSQKDAKITDLKESICQLEEKENRSSQEQESYIYSLNEQIKQHQDKFAQLNAVNENLLKELESVETAKLVYDKDISDLNEKLYSVSQNMSSLELSSEQTIHELQSENGKLNEVNIQLADKTKNYDVLEEKLVELKTELSSLEERNKSLETEKETLQVQGEVSSTDISEELSRAQSLLEEKVSTIAALEQQLEDAYSGNEEAIKVANEDILKLRNENARLLESRETFEEGLTKMHESLEGANKKVADYASMLEQWQSYDLEQKSYIESMSVQISDHQLSFEHLKSETDNAIAELTEKHASASIEAEKLNSDLDKTASEKEKLSDSISKLQTDLSTALQEKDKITMKTKGVMKAYKDNKVLLEKLKKELADKGESSSADSGEMDHLKSQVNELNLSRAALKESYEVLSEEKSQLLVEVESFEMEREFMTTLKDEATALKKINLEHSVTIETLQHELNNTTVLESELSMLKSTHQSSSDQIKELHKCVQDQESQINELCSIQNRHKQLCEDMGIDYCQLDEIVPILKSNSEQSTKSLEKLTSDITTFSEQLAARQVINIAQPLDVNALGDYFDNVVNIYQQMARVSAANDSEMIALKEQITALKGEVDILKADQIKLDCADSANQQHQETINLLKQKLEQSHQELAALESKLSQKEGELDVMASQWHTSIEQLSQKDTETKDILNRFAVKEEEVALMKENFENQVKNFHNTSGASEQAIAQLTIQRESLQADKQSLENALNMKSDRITQLMEENEAGKTQLIHKGQEMSEVKQEIEKLSCKLTLTEGEFETASEQLSTKDSTIQHLEEVISTIQAQLKEASNPDKHQEFLKSIQEKDSMIESLRCDLDQLQSELKLTLDDKQSLVSRFDLEKSSLNNDLKLLQNTLENIRTEVISKDNTVSAITEKCEHLQQQLLGVTENNASLQRTLDDNLVELNEVKRVKEELDTILSQTVAQVTELGQDQSTLKSTISELKTQNHELQSVIDKYKIEQDVLQKQVTQQNTHDVDVLQSKLTSSLELINTLEGSLLKSEENIGEVTANYEQKCLELSALERDMTNKKSQIEELKSNLIKKDNDLNEKNTLVSQIQSEFDDLVSKNGTLESRMHEALSGQTTELTSQYQDVQQKLARVTEDNTSLTENNTMLVNNNNQLSENYKQLHASVSVYQQRDTYLNDMCQKLQSHNESLTAHVQQIGQELTSKISVLETEKCQLQDELLDVKSVSETGPAVADLQEEISQLKSSKDKIISQVEAYQARLQTATSKAESLDKSLQDITARYNEQCSVVDKKTSDVAKLSRQYKYMKGKLVNELNARKSFVQETISGREKATMQIGEKSRRLRALQNEISSYQKDREHLVSAAEGIKANIEPLRTQLQSLIPASTDRSQPHQSVLLLEVLDTKTRDIVSYLSRPLHILSPPISHIDLSQYRDSDSITFSEYSRADSIVSGNSDYGDRSTKSEFSMYSEVTNASQISTNQTMPIIRGRSSSRSSTASERLKVPSDQINRTSTGVLNRLAYNLIGDTRGGTPTDSNS